VHEEIVDMFRHVVMFRWADGVDADHVADVARRLDELPEAISSIRAYRHGPDAGINDGNFDYVVVADFDSPDDYVTYRDHEVHAAFIADMIAGRVADRSAVQYRC
jgi:hypothetical protein